MIRVQCGKGLIEMENKEKKIKSLAILTTLLDFVKNDKYIIDTYYIENDLDACYAGSAVRKIPKVIGKTVEIKFSKIETIPEWDHTEVNPRVGDFTDDWKDLNIKNEVGILTEGKHDISMIVNGNHSTLYNIDLDDKKFILDLLIKGKLFYRLKPTNPQPIIIKSGDTWVAEYNGVDYLCTDSKRSGFLEEDFTPEKICEWWKPISEIEITDEIAKLRPMIINASLKRPLILYAVNRVGMFICEKGVEISLLNLATVKNLQEIIK